MSLCGAIFIQYIAVFISIHFYFPAAQFTYNRDGVNDLAAYIKEPQIPEEDEDQDSESDHEPMNDSGRFTRPALSDLDQGKTQFSHFCFFISSQLFCSNMWNWVYYQNCCEPGNGIN